MPEVKPRRFVIWCKSKGMKDEAAWAEPYHKRCADAEEEAREILAYFNDTLRPGEVERVLVRVELDAGDRSLSHNWRKTNLVTVAGRSMSYDTARCEDCGATSRRYGIGGDYTLDKKFKKRLACPGGPRTTRRVPRWKVGHRYRLDVVWEKENNRESTEDGTLISVNYHDQEAYLDTSRGPVVGALDTLIYLGP